MAVSARTWLRIVATLLVVLLLALRVPPYVQEAWMRGAVEDVPVPEGGVRVYARGHPTWPDVWAGPPTGSALYEYDDVEVEALRQAAEATLAQEGWSIRFSDGDVVAADRGGWRVTAKVGRWSAEGDGCCVPSDDPSRPTGLLLALFPS